MKHTKALTIAFILLIAFAAVNAELVINKRTNDFTLSSPSNEQLKMCSCSSRSDTVRIENVGTFPASYRVHSRTDYPGGLQVPIESFDLKPGEFEEFSVVLGNSCGLSGTYTYEILVTDSYGREERLDRTIDVRPCETLSFQVDPEGKQVGLCQPATFSATVRNIGDFAQTYRLDAGVPEENVEFSQREFTLAPGESKTQDVTFQFACSDYGTKVVPILATGEQTGQQARQDRTITIENQYDFALDLATSAQLCGQSTQDIPLTIKNLAPVPDTIDLHVDGARWIAQRSFTLELAAGESRTLQLELSPDEDFGAHTITVTGTSRLGGMSKSRSIDAQVDACYEPQVEIRSDEEHAVESVQTCCGPKTFYVNVRNAGDRDQALGLRLEGPSFFTLEETTVRLAPSENQNVKLNAQLPCTDESYPVRVIVYPLEAPLVNASATLQIESQTQRTCHMVQIDDDELTIREDESVVPVLVKQTGIEGGTYRVEINSTLFDVQEDSIDLSPGEQQAIHLRPKVNLTTQEKGRYLALPTLTYVPQGIDYRESLGVQLKGKTLWQRFSDSFLGLPWASVDVCGWVLFGLIALFIVLVVLLILVYAGTLAPIPRSRAWLMVARGAIVLFMGLVLLALAFLPMPGIEQFHERTASNQNATILEMYQNGELTIDLDRYFTDPDLDPIAYRATQPEHIRVQIEGSMMTLTPDHNFAGEESMVITAIDSKGAATDSPLFLVRVIARKDLTFLQWLDLWCLHLNATLVGLILLVLFLIVLTIPEERSDAPRGNVLVVVPESKKRKAPKKASSRKRSTRKAKSAAVKKASSKKTSPKKASLKKKASKKASKKRATKRRVASKRASKSVRAAKTSSKSLALSTPVRGVVVAEPMRQPLRENHDESRQNQTVNIAVGGANAAATPQEHLFVGSKSGNSVHRPECVVARRIPKKNRVMYGSKREALQASLVPCKVCRPFS